MIACKHGSGISDLFIFYFFLHFQVEARASRPPPSYAPEGHIIYYQLINGTNLFIFVGIIVLVAV